MNKKVIFKLEQIYNTSINEPHKKEESDVPYVDDDKEFKTNVIFPPLAEDSPYEPIVTTKKGKSVLSEPPVDDTEGNNDIDLFDDKGKEILFDDSDENEKTKIGGNYERNLSTGENPNLYQKMGYVGNKKNDSLKEILRMLEAKNDKVAQDNMPEQNPSSGEDPNKYTETGEFPNPAEQTAGPEGNQGTSEDPNNNGMNDPNAMQDPNSMGMNDPNAMGMMGPDGQPQKTPEELGKIYELKKIYARLLAIDSQLSFSPDIILLKLRKFVTNSIQLFETLISNVDVFKDQLDQIIVLYYKFIDEVLMIVKKYYENQAKEEEKQKNRSKFLP